MMRAGVAILFLSFGAIACSGGDSGGAAGACPGALPVQCKGATGNVVGCCPLDHPVCSADGTQCLEGSGGSGGSSGSGTGGLGASGSGASGGAGGSGAGGTGANGGSGGLGASGGVGGLGGVGGGTGGVSCIDQGFEPNETEATATDLGNITDCDGTGSSLSAKLDGADVDFYAYFGSDNAGCTVDPTATTGDAVRICLFAECNGVSASCTLGTPSSLGSLPGCCVTGGGTVTVNVNCSGLSDDATMYLRVDQGATGQCTDYSVAYHY